MAWLPSFLQSRAHAAVNEGFDWLRTWWTQTWRFTKRKERSDKETNGGEKKEPRTILSRTANESRNINQELQAGRRMAFLGCFHQNWWFNPPFFKETLEKLLNLLLILRKQWHFISFYRFHSTLLIWLLTIICIQKLGWKLIPSCDILLKARVINLKEGKKEIEAE